MQKYAPRNRSSATIGPGVGGHRPSTQIRRQGQHLLTHIAQGEITIGDLHGQAAFGAVAPPLLERHFNLQ